MADESVDVVEVEVDDLLDLISAAEDYGYGHSILMCSFADWLEELTDEQIESFARGFLTPEKREQGYGEEDYEGAKEKLERFRSRYMTNG